MIEMLAALLLAQPMPPLRVLDEGVVKGMASQVNCTGTGVTCTVNPTGVIWTLDVTGGGGGSYTLPAASGNVLGGIMVGARLSMSAGNVLSADVQTMTMDLTLPVYTRAGAPSCGPTWLSKEVRVHDSSQADETWVCELDYLGGYQWASYSQAPTPLDYTPLPVTVGASLAWSGASWSITSTAAGTAASTVASKADGSKTMAFFIAVGSPTKFTQVCFSGGRGASPLNTYTNSWGGMAVAGEGITVVGSGAAPTDSDVATGWDTFSGMPVPATPYGAACNAVTGVRGTQSRHYMQTITNWDNNGVAEYWMWEPFASSGCFSFTPSGGAGWTKGWFNTCAGMPTTTTPTGVVAGDYYWLIFPMYVYVDQCPSDPASGGVCRYSTTGPTYSNFTVRAVSVK